MAYKIIEGRKVNIDSKMTEAEKLQIALEAIHKLNNMPMAHIANHIAVQNNIQDAVRIISKIHEYGYTKESVENAGWEPFRIVTLSISGEKFLKYGGFEMNLYQKSRYWLSLKENNRWIFTALFTILSGLFLFLNYCTKNDAETLKYLRDSLSNSATSKIIPKFNTDSGMNNNLKGKENIIAKPTVNIKATKDSVK